jgi:hypothetical protein
MENLLIVAYVYAGLLFVSGWLLRRQTQQLIWMYLFWAVGIAVVLGAILFPAQNIRTNVAIHPYNTLGLDLILYAALSSSLPCGTYVLIRRKNWWPLAVVGVMGIVLVLYVIWVKSSLALVSPR